MKAIQQYKFEEQSLKTAIANCNLCRGWVVHRCSKNCSLNPFRELMGAHIAGTTRLVS